MSPQGIRNVYKIPITHRDYEQFGDLFSYVELIKSVKIYNINFMKRQFCNSFVLTASGKQCSSDL